MKHKRKALLSLILMMSLVLTACGGSQSTTPPPETDAEATKKGGRINIAVPFSPTTLDGDLVTAQDVNNIMNHVYEGLFEFNENYEPVPMLASGYTLEDNDTTYVIQLRDDVVFHNGDLMTSADVVASLNRWFHLNGTGRNVAEKLVSCRADGEHTVRVTFQEPYAPFIAFLAANVSNSKLFIRPESVCQAYPDSAVEDFTGSGPYKVKTFSPDQNLLLTRFEAYQANEGPTSGLSGERIPYADEINFQFVSEQSVRIAGVQSGQYQFAQGVPSDQHESMKTLSKIYPVVVKPSAQLLLILNQGGELLDDVRLRQALAMGIDPEKIASLAVGKEEFWTLNGCLFPEGTRWYDATAGEGIYNSKRLDDAKALMAEAEYDGTPIIILSQKENPTYSQCAIALQSQLEGLGFNVDLQLLDNAKVLELRAQKDGWDILVNSFLQPDPDPQVYGAWMGTNKWIGNWDDAQSAQMDDIFDRMLLTTDQNERYAIVQEWYDYFYETVPYVKLVDFSSLYIAETKLKGYANFSTPYFWNTWIEG